jgi:hypothetical protein
LREDWVTAHVQGTPDGNVGPTPEDVVEFNAETFRGESV